MIVLFVALHVGFVAPILLRAARRKDGPRAVAGELVAGGRRPALVVHAAGGALLWGGALQAAAVGSIEAAWNARGLACAVVMALAGVLVAWSAASLRSWRLLPNIETGHELCEKGPYGVVRHPIYLALDLLAIGTAVWAPTPPLILAAILLLIGGDLRARLEERFLLAAFGDRYRAYMERVARLVPALY